MTDEAPLGPRDFPLEKQPDEKFEELCHQLVRLEWPDARHTRNPDGGVDSLLPEQGGEPPRGWQAKHFTGNIRWAQCKESLDKAVKTYGVKRVTFCFPRNLTVGQIKKFNQDLVGRHDGVEVDYWDKSEISARLNLSEDGQKVANHYFGEDPHSKELLVRAIRARGPLEGPDDAVERTQPVGEFLKGHDPFFAYPQVTHEAKAIEVPPPAKGTVMSVGSTRDGVTVRLDAIPRHPDAMDRYGPRISLSFTDDEEGREAARIFQEATKKDEAVTLDKGVEVTPEQMPPLFKDVVGKPVKAEVQLKPVKPVPAPWRAEVSVESDLGEESLTTDLEYMDPPPEGADFAFQARYGGMTITIAARRVGDGGEMNVNWTHVLDQSPAREQVAALKMLAALHGKGELVIRDLVGGRPDIRHPTSDTEVPEDIRVLLSFLEDLVVIEDWVGRAIPLPGGRIKADEATNIARNAAFIRRKAIPVRFAEAKTETNEEALKQVGSGGVMRMIQDIGVVIFGEEIPFAVAILDLEKVEVIDEGPIEDKPGLHLVRIRPPGGEAVDAEWKLRPPEGKGQPKS